MSDIVDTFCELVRIDSESGNEEAVIAHLSKLFEQELNAECTRDEYGNLIARVAGRNSTKSEPIMLGAHADTVKPGIGIEPVVKDGVIRSAGETILGADDKAGIAEIFEAVRTAERRPPVEIVITRSEEIGLLGAKNLDLSVLKSELGFILDGEEPDTIVIGGPTHVSLDIDITGKAAHAGMEPERGISAIRVAAQAIASMPEGRLDEETTANVGTIHGGMIRNGVPEKVKIQAECRSLDDDKCMRQSQTMQNAFKSAADRAGATIDINENIEYAASKLPEDSPGIGLARSAISAAGFDPKTLVITGGTDALVLTGRGLPSVVMGYGGGGAHTTGEYIEVAVLRRAAGIVQQLLYAAA
ncbi:MAG: M20/M25/M40 family metallo-hydrolase [Candidatus Bipolaricaulota bacterium]|nr:M20/M25/M40 family metallo-hydrolase [Candidatus Bipolaricaulota bacterium]